MQKNQFKIPLIHTYFIFIYRTRVQYNYQTTLQFENTDLNWWECIGMYGI